MHRVLSEEWDLFFQVIHRINLYGFIDLCMVYMEESKRIAEVNEMFVRH